MLHDRIELSTSPLPRECSTTELVQRPDAWLPSWWGGAAQEAALANG